MIKNLLYSIFFHFLLIALIYANFNLKIPKENSSKQVSISLISKEDFESRFKTPKEEKEKKSPKKKSKKKKQEKPKSKSEVKSEPKVKSEEKSKPNSESPIPIKEKPKQETKEVKKEEKEIIKKEDEKELKEETAEEEKLEKKAEEIEPEKDEKEDEQQEKEKKLEDNKNDQSEKVLNNLESLNLSFREKFNIRSQLTSCYKRALEENNVEEDKISILVSVEISKDGFITSDLENNIDDKKYSEDGDYKMIINNVRKALEFCSPLRNLPLDKYDVWKEVSLEFGKIEELQKN